jgi:hypothetical protein
MPMTAQLPCATYLYLFGSDNKRQPNKIGSPSWLTIPQMFGVETLNTANANVSSNAFHCVP